MSLKKHARGVYDPSSVSEQEEPALHSAIAIRR